MQLSEPFFGSWVHYHTTIDSPKSRLIARNGYHGSENGNSIYDLVRFVKLLTEYHLLQVNMSDIICYTGVNIAGDYGRHGL